MSSANLHANSPNALAYRGGSWECLFFKIIMLSNSPFASLINPLADLICSPLALTLYWLCLADLINSPKYFSLANGLAFSANLR